ncbi:MAG: membrane protein insertion efficiency factor YidD [Patescibacteria group bacterium]
MKKLILGLIRLYQRTLSPDHGIFSQVTAYGCKFYPTCSEYAHQAISRHGVTSGGLMGLKRIGRCHPFTAGGVDEVPS